MLFRSMATKELALDGLAISITGDGESLGWSAADQMSPALTDRGVPGSMAVAWMQRIELAAGDRLLLGTATGAANFTLAGTSANSGTRNVHLGQAPRRLR